MNFGRSTDCNLILGINFNLMEEYDKAEDFFEKSLSSKKVGMTSSNIIQTVHFTRL